MMHGFEGWGMGFGGGIFMILFWILVIIGIVILIKFVTGGIKRNDGHESPLDVLKKRYARGEISKEEFEAKKRDLV
jgi:putative membrane protein